MTGRWGADRSSVSRRALLRTGAALGGGALFGHSATGRAAMSALELPMANGTRELVRYPQKREMLLMTARPVQLETPFQVFGESLFTPNDAFFVRWHLANVPTTVDATTFRIQVRGAVRSPLTLSLAELKTRFEPVEIAAVCQCAGNGRGFFDPRVPGGQWGNGAMGNALWRGVRLKDILGAAGVRAGAVQVRFNGADGPVLPATPDFVKALDVDTALGSDVLVAYAMNGAPLPLLNGYPVRLVVPGWYATYWVKMLDDIEVIDEADANFWMKRAYRIPDNECACTLPGQPHVATTPIGRMDVRSFVTSVADGATLQASHTREIEGVAFDGGSGIARVLFSSDAGRTWREATLGKDYGRYGFREWRAAFTPQAGRRYELRSLAINDIGETQRLTPRWNAPGYMRNVVESVRVDAV